MSRTSAFLSFLVLATAVVAHGQFPVNMARMDHDPTSEDTLHWVFIVSSPVTGVEASDFTVTPSPTGPLPIGVSSRSADLTGVDRLICTNAVGFPTVAFTVEFWAKTTDGNGTLVSYFPNSGPEAFRLKDPDGLDLQIGGVEVITDAADIADGAWHHVAFTWSSATGDATLIIDATVVATGVTGAGTVFPDSGSFCVFQTQSGPASGFGATVDGEVDEVRVWKLVRNATQIGNFNMVPAVTPNAPALALYWPIEDHEPLGVGSTGTANLRDLTINRNHASSEPGFGPLPNSPVMSDRHFIVRVTTAGLPCNGDIGVDFVGNFVSTAGGGPVSAYWDGPEYAYVSPQPTFTGVTATSVTPPLGSCVGGDTVTITGSDFLTAGVDTVLFGETPGTDVVVHSETMLTVQAPAPDAPNVAVDVTVSGPCSNIVTLPLAFTPIPTVPTITAITPDNVGCEGGLPVVIQGTGFMHNDVELIDTVRLLGIDVDSFVVISDTEIHAVTPAFPGSGTGPVTVLGPCVPTAGLAGFTVDLFTIAITGVMPDTGTCSGGDVVQVTGSGFLGGGAPRVDWVEFGGVVSQQVVVLSDTLLEVVTPAFGTVGSAETITAGGDCATTATLPAAFTGALVLAVPGDFATIAQAVAAACDGVVIEIAPGLYLEHDIALGNLDITVRGTASAADTVIDAQGLGRIFHTTGAAQIEDLTLRGGVTSSSGGAIFAEVPSGELFRLRRCRVEDNHADLHGGAVRVRGNGTSRIANVAFIGNTSAQSGGAVAVRHDVSTPITEILNCRFVGNHAGERGGALFIGPTADALVVHATMYANTAVLEEGALFAESDCELVSSIVHGNSFGTGLPSDQIGGPGPFDIHDSLIQGGAAGTNVIDADPRLRDDLGRLLGASPCIGTADPTPGIPIPSTDVDGCPRFGGPTRDMGAAEFQPPAHPGTGEDLRLQVVIDGTPPDDCDPGAARVVLGGEALTLVFESPLATFDGSVPVLVGQLFTTGMPPVDAFPGIQIDLMATPLPFILFDGNATGGPFGPVVLPPQGLTFLTTMPPLPPGTSVLLQAIALTPLADNTFLASSDGIELQVL